MLLLLNFNLPAAAAIHTQLCPIHACTLAKVPASLALTFPSLRADALFRPRHSKKQNLPGVRKSLASRPSYHHECTTRTVRQCRSMHPDPKSSQIVWWQAFSIITPYTVYGMRNQMHRGSAAAQARTTACIVIKPYCRHCRLQCRGSAEGLCFSNVHLEPKYSFVQAAAAPHSHVSPSLVIPLHALVHRGCRPNTKPKSL